MYAQKPGPSTSNPAQVSHDCGPGGGSGSVQVDSAVPSWTVARRGWGGSCAGPNGCSQPKGEGYVKDTADNIGWIDRLRGTGAGRDTADLGSCTTSLACCSTSLTAAAEHWICPTCCFSSALPSQLSPRWACSEAAVLSTLMPTTGQQCSLPSSLQAASMGMTWAAVETSMAKREGRAAWSSGWSSMKLVPTCGHCVGVPRHAHLSTPCTYASRSSRLKSSPIIHITLAALTKVWSWWSRKGHNGSELGGEDGLYYRLRAEGAADFSKKPMQCLIGGLLPWKKPVVIVLLFIISSCSSSSPSLSCTLVL